MGRKNKIHGTKKPVFTYHDQDITKASFEADEEYEGPRTVIHSADITHPQLTDEAPDHPVTTQPETADSEANYEDERESTTDDIPITDNEIHSDPTDKNRSDTQEGHSGNPTLDHEPVQRQRRPRDPLE